MTTYTIEEAERTWLGADAHFEHINIIRYCHRPFRNVGEMNHAILKNWNDTVGPDDTAYFLGDLGYGRYYRDPIYWLRRMNGRITFIEGSHDKKMPRSLMKPYETIRVDGVRLLLIHNYQDAPRGWDDWIIHGHNHQKRPFIMPYRKRVNVSMEAIDYRPISLAKIVECIREAR